jgi:hydroxyacylglutathione hydrolase
MNDATDLPQVHPLHMGLTTCYLIRGKSSILVDGGMPGKAGAFRKELERLSVDPAEIKLIILTHAHFDHDGSANEIRKLTGAKILIHHLDRPGLTDGKGAEIRGFSRWGRISFAMMKPFFNSVNSVVVVPDIVMEEEEMSLQPWGIDGRILHTPGHTPGSLSVLLSNGDAFVGCMAHNRLPFTLHPRLPIYATQPESFAASWAKLTEGGARQIYPGHGKSFAIGRIRIPA